MNKISNFSFAALALSLFILLIAFLTTVIDTPTFINRVHTAIIAWHLPLAAIALLAYAFVKENGEEYLKKFRLLAIVALVAGLFCTNLTKNTVQDVVSNTSNYVDVATATVEKEAKNIVEYGIKLSKAAERAEDSMHPKRYDAFNNWD